jgi:hypothetical protein
MGPGNLGAVAGAAAWSGLSGVGMVFNQRRSDTASTLLAHERSAAARRRSRSMRMNSARAESVRERLIKGHELVALVFAHLVSVR